MRIKLILLTITVLALSGCTIIHTQVYPPAGTGNVEITVTADKVITTTPSLQADGNDVKMIP